jgi:hypothetical protein
LNHKVCSPVSATLARVSPLAVTSGERNLAGSSGRALTAKGETTVMTDAPECGDMPV